MVAGRRERARRYGNWLAECRERARRYAFGFAVRRGHARRSAFGFAVRRGRARRYAFGFAVRRGRARHPANPQNTSEDIFSQRFFVSFYKITGQPSLSQSPALEVEQRLRLPYRPYDFPLGLGQYTHQAGLAIFPQIRAQ